MELNNFGEIISSTERSSAEASGQTRPMLLETVKDSNDRLWYELPSGQWLCQTELSEPDNDAAGAWNYWKRSGFDRYLGWNSEDLSARFGPIKQSSVEVLGEDRSLDLSGMFTATREHCNCPDRGTLTGEKEQEKQLRDGDYTYCVACGKLRP